jgi:hypothetical protein
VVAGTASAVNGRVQRRQAAKFAEKDAQVAARQDAAYQQQVYAQAPPPPPPAAAPATDVVTQLKALAELKDQGILTEAEFAAQKAKILAG